MTAGISDASAQETVRTVAAVVGSTATTLAVIVALFRDSILRWWRRANLILVAPAEASQDVDWVSGSPDVFSDHEELWVYLRLKVANIGRATQAEDAQVVVVGVSKGARAPGRSLKWAHHPSDVLDIPSGSFRRVDVIRRHVTRPVDSTQLDSSGRQDDDGDPGRSPRAPISVLICAVMPGDDFVWPPGAMNTLRAAEAVNRLRPVSPDDRESIKAYVELELVAKNVRPSRWRVRFDWTEWEPPPGWEQSDPRDRAAHEARQKQLLAEFSDVRIERAR